MDFNTVVDWTPETLIALVVVLVLFDKLIPSRRLRDMEKRSDKYEKAYNEEKDAHRLTIKAYDETVKESLKTLLAGQRTANATLEGLRRAAGEQD